MGQARYLLRRKQQGGDRLQVVLAVLTGWVLIAMVASSWLAIDCPDRSATQSYLLNFTATREKTRESTATNNSTAGAATNALSTTMIDNDRGMKIGACLVVMDDNHWLIEWLAYHYTTLPLTNLILAVDPKSRTSPSEILSRWEDKIHIDVLWNWTHLQDDGSGSLLWVYEEKEKGIKNDSVRSFRARQRDTYYHCMSRFRDDEVDWALFVDTDEFVKIPSPHRTLEEYLSSKRHVPDKENNVTCLTLDRFGVGSEGLPVSGQEKYSELGIAAHKMLTTQFRLRNDEPMKTSITPTRHLGKNLIHVRDIQKSYLPVGKQRGDFNVHRNMNGCNDLESEGSISLFHYAGSEDQFNFRDDPRSKNERQSYRLRSGSDLVPVLDNSLTMWLDQFISKVGNDEARRLLSGVGKIEINPISNDMDTKKEIDWVHVMMGLYGNNTGFFSEVEVALKSILLNAPMDLNMQIHFLADHAAAETMRDLLDRVGIEKWQMRNTILLTIHDISDHIDTWKAKVRAVFDGKKFRYNNAFRHTIGAYFRLFASEVFDADVRNVLYLDSDVVITSNLQALWTQLDSSKLFHWGAMSRCSGFMVINVQEIGEIWESIPLLDPWKETDTPGDQIIFQYFEKKFPDRVGQLPLQWDISARNGFNGNSERNYWKADPNLVSKWLKDGSGMLHFNGGKAEEKSSYFHSHPILDGKFENTFGIAKFYVDLPWSWAKFHVEALRAGSSIDNMNTPIVKIQKPGGKNRGAIQRSFQQNTSSTSYPLLVSSLQAESGIIGPIDLSDILSTANGCAKKYNSMGNAWKEKNLTTRPYQKSPFAYLKECRDIALHPRLIEQAKKIIGEEDIMLASMSSLLKRAGHQHRWHSDFESVVDPSCTEKVWTAWIPAWGSAEGSEMHFVTHTSNVTTLAQTYLVETGYKQSTGPEELTQGKTFEELGKELILKAQQENEKSRYVRISPQNGFAWFFQGTTYHGSINRSDKSRTAFQFHFMPARCKFRLYPMGTTSWPKPTDLKAELPFVIPILGDDSKSIYASPASSSEAKRSKQEPFPFNNWMFEDMRLPQQVYAPFDRTDRLVAKGLKAHEVVQPEIFNFPDGWIDGNCNQESLGAKKLYSQTKCQMHMLEGRTKVLRHIEYHATQLPKNSVAHGLRYHEEYEFLYMVRGKAVVSLGQPGPFESLVHRREVTAGEFLFYPAWQRHGSAAVDDPQATYIAIRWLGRQAESPVAPSNIADFKGTDEFRLKIRQRMELSKHQNMSVQVQTVGERRTKRTVPLDRSESDILILMTRGSASLDGQEIISPGTAFVPKSDIGGGNVTLALNRDSIAIVAWISER